MPVKSCILKLYSWFLTVDFPHSYQIIETPMQIKSENSLNYIWELR